MRPVFDAHLDLAWNALSFNRDLSLPVAHIRREEAEMVDAPCRGNGLVTLPALKEARVAVCVATLLARSGPRQSPKKAFARHDLDYRSQSIAHATAWGQLAYYQLLARQDYIRLIQTAAELEQHWDSWTRENETRLGVILSMEGCDPIVRPEEAELWWNAGLRAAGLAHYGPSHYAFGTGSDGSVTREGKALLTEFERLGITLDVTHLCDRSMEEALDLFGGPLLASHHNCRSLTPHERQLTDQQLSRLISRGAVIGVALDAWMLVPGWTKGVSDPAEASFEHVADHIGHVCQIAGDARHSAIGSDLDGGFGREQAPGELKRVADLQRLADILSNRGFKDTEIDAIFWGNWLRFFQRTLPAQKHPPGGEKEA